jgi:hypothetical protein
MRFQSGSAICRTPGAVVDPGHVDQRVEMPKAVRHRGKGRRHVFRIGDVAGQRQISVLRKIRSLSVEQRKPVPRRAEHEGGRATDVARRPGDQRHTHR